MILHLTTEQLLELHGWTIARSGGGPGLRDAGTLDSCLAQPMASFDGVDLYPTLQAKASALGFLLVANHPFVDGNKRIGHAAMEVMLVMNGYELRADVDEQESLILAVASGQMKLDAFAAWVSEHLVAR